MVNLKTRVCVVQSNLKIQLYIIWQNLKGIVHYFTISILKECAVNGHHNGGILSFYTFTNREKWTK